MVELAILGLLQDQPLHGYELHKRLSEMVGFLFGFSFGSLYPALRRLEKSGAIEATTSAPRSTQNSATGSLDGEAAMARRFRSFTTGRARKAYRITSDGQILLKKLLNEPGATTGDDERTFGLRLVFSRFLTKTERIAFLEHRRNVLTSKLKATKETSVPTIDPYMSSLIQHKTATIAADLKWVDALIAQERAGTSRVKEGATA